nr:hypothetical protein [uncultured Roseateles sp.]
MTPERRREIWRNASRRYYRGTPLPPIKSLRERLLEWFEAAPPGECLSAVDVSVKFGVTLRYARNTLSVLKAEGAIQRETVWRKAQP